MLRSIGAASVLPAELLDRDDAMPKSATKINPAKGLSRGHYAWNGSNRRDGTLFETGASGFEVAGRVDWGDDRAVQRPERRLARACFRRRRSGEAFMS